MQAVITQVQRFSTGDGPGIRSTVFFKGCNLACPWCHNPETQSPRPEIDCRGRQWGEAIDLERLMERLQEDRAFYEASGGGVTLSGGEPLLQADFCAALAEGCRSQGISVAVDTAGDVPFAAFEPLLPLVQLFYVDLKGPDQAAYDRVGGSLDRVLNNMARLAARRAPLVARIPIIPGHNDAPEDAERMAALLQASGVERVNLLPFHRMGSSKYQLLGRSYPYQAATPPEKSKMLALLAPFARAGLEAALDG